MNRKGGNQMKSPLKKSSFLLACLSLLAILLALSLTAGCTSKSINAQPGSHSSQSSYASTSYDLYEEVKGENTAAASDADASANVALLSAAQPKKMVKNAQITLETLYFQETADGIARSAEEAGGYVQASQIDGESLYTKGSGGRRASFTLRIPAEKLEEYLQTLSQLGNVLSQNQDSQDISDSYYDTQARLTALQAQESRLLELMEQAENLEQLLQIEDSLTQVRYQIESLTATMKRYDADVAYSTVTVQMWEVEEYREEEHPDTFGGKIQSAFRRSGENFLEVSEEFLSGLIVVLPVVLIYGGLIALVVVMIVRLIRKKRGKTPRLPVSGPPKDGSADPPSEKR